jgi:hypothetical protein
MRLFLIFVVDLQKNQKIFTKKLSQKIRFQKKIEGAGETRTLSTSWSSNPKLLNLKYTNLR